VKLKGRCCSQVWVLMIATGWMALVVLVVFPTPAFGFLANGRAFPSGDAPLLFPLKEERSAARLGPISAPGDGCESLFQ